jgi:hypothetical protein
MAGRFLLPFCPKNPFQLSAFSISAFAVWLPFAAKGPKERRETGRGLHGSAGATCHFPLETYNAAMPARNPMKGISRIDQPEKHNHGFFVRLAREGKTHSAFFADKSHGGRQKALAAARQHYEMLLAKFGSVGKSVQPGWMKEAIGGRRKAKAARPPGLDPPQLIWVQCHGYRCLAYRDPRGRWINFYTGTLITGAVKPIY